MAVKLKKFRIFKPVLSLFFTCAVLLLSASCCFADFYWDEPFDDYKQNPIQAENKWVGMRLNFNNDIAEVRSIGKNIWGQPYIGIKNANGRTKTDYTFYFSDTGPYPRQLLEAREGQRIKISGVVDKLNFDRLFGIESLTVVLGRVEFLD